MSEQIYGERLAALETDLKNHRQESSDRFDTVNEKLDQVANKLDGFSALLNQAKGAKWLLAVIAGGTAWYSGVGDWVKHLLK